MIGTYASAALICLASLLVGRATFTLAGRRSWCWLEPAVGFAAILAVSGLLARAPGHGTSATLGIVVLIVVAAAVVWRRREYEALFAGRVSGAQAALSRASGRRLTPRQRETVQMIRTFLKQAEESKVKDLVTALELARRADLLGRDLLKSLQ